MPSGVYVRTEKHRIKLSIAGIGNKNAKGNKGKKLSEEHKKKISKANSGKILSEEHKKKLRKLRKGKKHTIATKKKMSETRKGKNNGFFGKTHIKKSKIKISESNKGENSFFYGKHLSKEHKRKISESEKNKKVSSDTRKKIRLNSIKRIQKRLKKGQQLYPNWNPKACNYFEQFDKDSNTHGQYATDGGEFYIKELGYWPDYINHDLKLIMEYDENYHFDVNGNLKEKDIKRQKEIEELYSDYKFIRVKEESEFANTYFRFNR